MCVLRPVLSTGCWVVQETPQRGTQGPTPIQGRRFDLSPSFRSFSVTPRSPALLCCCSSAALPRPAFFLSLSFPPHASTLFRQCTSCHLPFLPRFAAVTRSKLSVSPYSSLQHLSSLIMSTRKRKQDEEEEELQALPSDEEEEEEEEE